MVLFTLKLTKPKQMKFFKILFFTTSFIVGVSSCKHDITLLDENNKQAYLDANSANIKVIDVFAGNTPFLPTAPSILYTGPQFFIYANGAKLNGTPIGYINGTQYLTATAPTIQPAIPQDAAILRRLSQCRALDTSSDPEW